MWGAVQTPAPSFKQYPFSIHSWRSFGTLQESFSWKYLCNLLQTINLQSQKHFYCQNIPQAHLCLQHIYFMIAIQLKYSIIFRFDWILNTTCALSCTRNQKTQSLMSCPVLRTQCCPVLKILSLNLCPVLSVRVCHVLSCPNYSILSWSPCSVL